MIIVSDVIDYLPDPAPNLTYFLDFHGEPAIVFFPRLKNYVIIFEVVRGGTPKTLQSNFPHPWFTPAGGFFI
jgi:hypothetical protein